VELEPVASAEDQNELKGMIENHLKFTGSAVAKRILASWTETLTQFRKVMPVDYKKALLGLPMEKAKA